MFLFSDSAQAFLVLAPQGGFAFAPVAGFQKGSLASLLRLDRDGAKRRLLTLTGRAVAAAPEGYALVRQDAPRALRFEVTTLESGEVVLARRGAFLRAGKGGAVTADAPSADQAVRFRLLGAGAAFAKVEPRLVRRWSGPSPAGRLMRFPQKVDIGPEPAEFRDARIIAQDWLVLAPGGLRHVRPNKHGKRRAAQQQAIAYPLPAPGRLETACLLGGYYNYYHHLVDYLVNWFDVRDRIGEEVKLITLPPDQRFQAEILDAFGIADRIVPVPALSAVRARRLIVPRPAFVLDGVLRDATAVEACRAFLDARIAAAPDAPRRIFISRAEAPTRRAPNEEQAIAIARRHGFTPIRLETLSFLEQVALFRRAEAVTGLHGAGFANLIFAPSGCRVIEIMPTDPLQPGFFANVSAGLGLPFRRVAARGAFHAMDLEIDLDGLAAALPD